MSNTKQPALKQRPATLSDASWLGEWNAMLIRDEGHRNIMTVPELEMRMRNWLSGKYQAVVFELQGAVVAYALYRIRPSSVYLRQFFVHPRHRGKGVGREAMRILSRDVWPRNLSVVVDVLLHNEQAREFWKAVGFQDYSIAMERLPEERG